MPLHSSSGSPPLKKPRRPDASQQRGKAQKADRERHHAHALHFAGPNALDRGITGAAIDGALSNRDDTRQGDVTTVRVADPAHRASRRFGEGL